MRQIIASRLLGLRSSVERLDQLSGETLHLRGLRQCLRVDVFPDVCEFPVSNGYCEDPMILEHLIRRFSRPLGESDDENPISLRYEFRRRRVGNLRRVGSTETESAI